MSLNLRDQIKEPGDPIKKLKQEKAEKKKVSYLTLTYFQKKPNRLLPEY